MIELKHKHHEFMVWGVMRRERQNLLKSRMACQAPLSRTIALANSVPYIQHRGSARRQICERLISKQSVSLTGTGPALLRNYMSAVHGRGNRTEIQ
jgi:hypothetical protein